MKNTSTCERLFISNCIIKKQKRIDGRQLLQGRTLEIVFGTERGCCMVLQGNTRVLVQVSCEISEPKTSTPTEGVMHVNLEYSAMASPDAKSVSRTSEECVEAQRAIERCVRDSKCIDLESLCIVTGSKVWAIRTDVHVLNNDGNLIECASIAAVSALAHFRRPEVTVIGTDVTVHSIEEKEPVALNLHHMPLSINLALFDEGKTILVDPNEMEERVCDGCYIIGMNAHQEICFVHRRGILLLKENSVQQCENIAVQRAQEVTQIIRAALDDDAYKRVTSAPIGFTNLIQSGTILGTKRPMAEIDLDSVKSLQDTKPQAADLEMITDVPGDQNKSDDLPEFKRMDGDRLEIRSQAKERAMHILEDSEAAIFEGGPSKWGGDLENESSSEEEEEDTNDDNEVAPEEISDTKSDMQQVKHEISLDSSEEEETVYVNKDLSDVKTSTSRGWYSKDPFK